MASTASSRFDTCRVTPGELDRHVEAAGVQRHAVEVGRLHVDEAVGAQAGVDRLDRADAALQLADHVFEDHVAFQPDPGVDQRLDGA